MLLFTLFKVLTAAKRIVGLGELKNNCKTEIAGESSLDEAFFKLQIAFAAS